MTADQKRGKSEPAVSGIDQGTYRGHEVFQVGMSDDGLPYYRCRNCDWGRVGGLPDQSDRPCAPASLIERVARRMSVQDDGALLLAGVGPIPWERLHDADRATYLAYAQVAVEAVREFTT